MVTLGSADRRPWGDADSTHRDPTGHDYAIGVVFPLRFLETPVFTAAIRGLLTDESYRALQLALLLRPEQGALIPGSGGLRKVRWGGRGRGKRGGIRVIYVWVLEEEAFYMLFAYAKGTQADLTMAQVKRLRRLVEEELG